MANFCSNMIAFEGNASAIAAIQTLFTMMAEKQEQHGNGQLPPFITEQEGYFFDIYCDEENDGAFRYETRWSPNTTVVLQIAEHFRVNFTLDYEELGNGVYGKATYKDGVLTDTFLENEDFNSYEYDDEEDAYHFEGETFEGDWEILETLLERKIAKL